MRKELWLGVKTVLAFLVVLSLLDYFFPLLYPLDASVVEFGTPFVFYTVNLGAVPRCQGAGSLERCAPLPADGFGAAAFLGDLVFAYALGVFAVFVRNKFEEGSSPIFKWSLRGALFLAAIVFILRLFIRNF